MFRMLSHWNRFSPFSWYLNHLALKTQWKWYEVVALNWAPIIPSYLAVIPRAGTEEHLGPKNIFVELFVQ